MCCKSWISGRIRSLELLFIGDFMLFLGLLNFGLFVWKIGLVVILIVVMKIINVGIGV